MAHDSSSDDLSSKLRSDLRIDEACERFEEAWQKKQSPRIEKYLEGWQEPQRKKLFRQLLLVECELRHGDGQEPSAESWTNRFPEYTDLIGDIVEGKPLESDDMARKQIIGMLPTIGHSALSEQDLPSIR